MKQLVDQLRGLLPGHLVECPDLKFGVEEILRGLALGAPAREDAEQVAALGLAHQPVVTVRAVSARC